MPLASLPRWSGPGTDAARLNALRARAVARLEEEERAAGVVWPVAAVASSRRGVLRRFGILLAGVVPGVAALVKAQSALAESPMGSVRACAPQYGAPSWPAERTPYVEVPAVSHSREDLGKVKAWHDAGVLVVSEKQKVDRSGYAYAAAKTAYYADGWGGGTHTLMAVGDPDADVAYIMRGDQRFYAVVDGEMYGYVLGPGSLSVHGSLFRRKGDKDGLAGVIADFAKVDDREAYERDRAETVINLEKGLPQVFWIRHTERGFENSYVNAGQVRRKGNVMELTVLSSEVKSQATFTIDLAAQKLVKTLFDGKEWAA